MMVPKSAPSLLDAGRRPAEAAPRGRRSRAARALLAAALVAAPLVALPQAAYAAPGNDLGALNVDCDGSDGGYLEEQTIFYLELGDTFVISNLEYEACTIADPNSILTGEDADFSGLGAGILDVSSTTTPITIDAPGTFTIADGDGRVKTFTVVQGISFRNPTRVGEGAAIGDSFLYSRVFFTGSQYVDATVTIVDITGLVPDGAYLDGASANWPLSPGIDVDGAAGRGTFTFRIDFHESGNPAAPVSLDDVVMTVKDIDSEQFIAAPGVASFSLSSTPATALTATAQGGLLTVAEVNDVSSSDEDEDHWVVLRFGTVSSVTLTVGANQEGGASFDALFTEADWSEAPTTQAPSDLAPEPELAATGANSALIAPAKALLVGLLLAGSVALGAGRRRALVRDGGHASA